MTYIYVVFPGPLFFLGCFSVAVGMAFLYYYSGKYISTLKLHLTLKL